MKKSILLLISIFLINFADAQNIVPFQNDDPVALEITDEVIDLLCSTTWFSFKHGFQIDGHQNKRDIQFNTTFSLDRTFSESFSIYEEEEKGEWYLESETLLNLSPPPGYEIQGGHKRLIGGFSIYKISEHELILGKVLNSKHNNRIVLYFESEKRNMERMAATRRNTKSKEQLRLEYKKKIEKERLVKKFINGELEEESDVILVQGFLDDKISKLYDQKGIKRPIETLSKEALFIHGLSPKGKKEMSNEELIKLYNQLKNEK